MRVHARCRLPFWSLVLLLTLLVVVPGAFVGAGTARAAEPVGTGISDLKACLAGRSSADIVVLVDQSASLRDTDPTDQRVTAARLLLGGLAQTVATSDKHIRTLVAGFDADLQEHTPWTPLDEQTLPAALAAVDGFAARDSGLDTDYWMALNAAHGLFAPGKGPSAPCKAVLLLTDGQYSVEPRDTAARRDAYSSTKPVPGAEDVELTDAAAARRVVEAGTTDLCRPGGLADALRVDGIDLIAVGLQNGADVDFSLMRSITTSTDGSCGTQPPDGAFVLADDPLDLLFRFSDLTTDGVSGGIQQGGICRDQDCAGYAHHFTLDESLRDIQVLAAADAPGVDVEVTVPGGSAPATFRWTQGAPDSDQTLGSVVVHGHWDGPQALTFSAQFPPGGQNWSGQWGVTFVDRAGTSDASVSRTRLELRSGLSVSPAAGTATTWTAGQDVDVPLQLVGADGNPVTLPAPSPTLAVKVDLLPGDGSAALPVASGDLAAVAATRWAVPAELSGTAQLRTTLTVTSLGGLQLEPSERTVPLTIAPPPGYPTTAATLDLGRTTGTEQARGNLPVTGPGCVWVRGGDVSVAPSSVSGVAVTSDHDSRGDCLRLTGEGSQDLTVIAQPDTAGNGSVRGTLVAHLVPEDGTSPERSVPVAYSLELRRERNTAAWLALLATAVVAGLGLPFLGYVLVRRWAARFPRENESLQAVVLPVALTGRGMLVGGRPLRDLAGQVPAFLPPPTNGRRRQQIAGFTFLARAGWSPTRAGHVDVLGADFIGTSSSGTGPDPKTGRLRASLALQNSWHVLADRDAVAAGEPVPATLVLVVSPQQSPQEKLLALVAAAQAVLPDRLAALRAAVGLTSPPAAPSAPGSAEPHERPRHDPDDDWGAGWSDDVPGSAPGSPPSGPPSTPATPTSTAKGGSSWPPDDEW